MPPPSRGQLTGIPTLGRRSVAGRRCAWRPNRPAAPKTPKPSWRETQREGEGGETGSEGADVHLTRCSPPTPTPQRTTTATWAVCHRAPSPQCHSDTPCREACLPDDTASSRLATHPPTCATPQPCHPPHHPPHHSPCHPPCRPPCHPSPSLTVPPTVSHTTVTHRATCGQTAAAAPHSGGQGVGPAHRRGSAPGPGAVQHPGPSAPADGLPAEQPEPVAARGLDLGQGQPAHAGPGAATDVLFRTTSHAFPSSMHHPTHAGTCFPWRTVVSVFFLSQADRGLRSEALKEALGLCL